jgi:hypothetical protein
MYVWIFVVCLNFHQWQVFKDKWVFAHYGDHIWISKWQIFLYILDTRTKKMKIIEIIIKRESLI